MNLDKQPNENNHTAHDPFLEERLHQLRQSPPLNTPPGYGYYENPYGKMTQKSKFMAGLLAFFFPGMGHFYLGLMQRGFTVLLCFALNIVAIAYNATLIGPSIPLMVLLGLMVPGIYFYNLFDALQCTDRLNAERIYGYVPEGMTPLTGNGTGLAALKGSPLGIILIICGVFVLLFSVKPDWLRFLFSSGGPYFGAILLICFGLFLLFRTKTK